MTESAYSRRRQQSQEANGTAANGRAIGFGRAPRVTAEHRAATLDVPFAASDAEGDGARLRLELDQLRSERTHLLAAKEELAAVLEERTRRAQQLLGERAQLETRLRERDQQIQHLNRELGTASRPVQKSPAPSSAAAAPGLGARLAAVAGRLAVRLKRSQMPSASLPPKLLPTAGARASLQPHGKEEPARPLVLVLVLGLGRDELSGALQLVTRYCTAHAMTPLLLTDHDGLEVFRTQRMLFEYLPPTASRARLAPDLDWDLYVQRRLALIRRKWEPARIIAFGSCAAAVARLWRGSPFEDEGIKELIGVTDRVAVL